MGGENSIPILGIIAFLLTLILLACPLMHLFGHGGHGSHANPSSSENDRQPASGHERAKAALRREESADSHMH